MYIIIKKYYYLRRKKLNYNNALSSSEWYAPFKVTETLRRILHKSEVLATNENVMIKYPILYIKRHFISIVQREWDV